MLGKILILSSLHMRPETSQMLCRTPWHEWPVSGNHSEFGFFLYAHDENDGTIPADLWAVMCFARERGAEYILFDHDAATVEGLPTFDWEGK